MLFIDFGMMNSVIFIFKPQSPYLSMEQLNKNSIQL